jgi:hypothetical protein
MAEKQHRHALVGALAEGRMRRRSALCRGHLTAPAITPPATQETAMRSPYRPSLWTRLTGRRVRRALRAPEPADLGTAFGMEQ